MHDGRFPNLDPLILNDSNNKLGAGPALALTQDEKARIVAFLRTLTDTTFTHDLRFAKQ